MNEHATLVIAISGPPWEKKNVISLIDCERDMQFLKEAMSGWNHADE